MSFLYVFLGGGLGASLRYAFGLMGEGQFYSVLIPNLIGCALIGLCIPFFEGTSGLRLFFIVGLLGGFTTFSSYMLFLGRADMAQALNFFLIHHLAGFALFYGCFRFSLVVRG